MSYKLRAGINMTGITVSQFTFNENRSGIAEDNTVKSGIRSAVIGLVGIVISGSIFIYNLINPVGSFSLYTYLGFPTCWMVLFLVGFALLNSIIILSANRGKLLNM